MSVSAWIVKEIHASRKKQTKQRETFHRNQSVHFHRKKNEKKIKEAEEQLISMQKLGCDCEA